MPAEFVADGLLAGSPPALIGSECRLCGVVAFPRQRSCASCTSTDVEEHRLARRGTLWTWTIQGFPPKSPPYAGTAEDFEPYGVGYVELPGELRIEALLTEADPGRLRIGMSMELVLVPAPGPGGALTYAFQPVEEPGHRLTRDQSQMPIPPTLPEVAP